MTEKENMIDNNPPENPTNPPEGGVVPPVSSGGDPIFGPMDVPTSTEGEASVPPTEDQADEPESEDTFTKMFGDIETINPQHAEEIRTSPELAERMKNASSILGDKEKTADELAAHIKTAGIPRKYVSDVLRAAGHDEDKINQVLTDPDLPPDPTPREETLEDTEKVEDAMSPEGVVEEGKELSEEGRDLEAREDATDEEIDDHNKKVSKWKEKVKHRLFNGDNGLLRDEHRIRRLVVKPTVSILLAILIMYIASLSAITKGSAKKAGH